MALFLQDIDLTNNEIEQEFLQNISIICLNLKKFQISSSFQYEGFINNNNTNEKLYTFIQKQKNLKEFKVLCCEHLLDNIFLFFRISKIFFSFY